MRPKLVVNNDPPLSVQQWIDSGYKYRDPLKFQVTINVRVEALRRLSAYQEKADRLDKFALQLSQHNDRREITAEKANGWLEVETRKAIQDYSLLWESETRHEVGRVYQDLMTGKTDAAPTRVTGMGVTLGLAHRYKEVLLDDLGDDFSIERERIDAEMIFELYKARYETVVRWAKGGVAQPPKCKTP